MNGNDNTLSSLPPLTVPILADLEEPHEDPAFLMPAAGRFGCVEHPAGVKRRSAGNLPMTNNDQTEGYERVAAINYRTFSYPTAPAQ